MKVVYMNQMNKMYTDGYEYKLPIDDDLANSLEHARSIAKNFYNAILRIF